MPPVARTLQEPVELPRGVLFALLIEHDADDGRRALRCHWHYGFGWCGRHITAAALGSAGAQPRVFALAQYNVFLHCYQLDRLKTVLTRGSLLECYMPLAPQKPALPDGANARVLRRGLGFDISPYCKIAATDAETGRADAIGSTS